MRYVVPKNLERISRFQIKQFRRATAGIHPRSCPLCGYEGAFTTTGRPPRYDALCLGCGSLERHRLVTLWLDRTKGALKSRSRVLHFAPEPQIGARISEVTSNYETADLVDTPPVTHTVNIEDTGLPEKTYDMIVCSHVLEHVDDKKALSEIYRLLKPRGVALLMTPIVESWEKTYENPEVKTPEERLLHFGQEDHVRIYGRDFRERVRAAGFDLKEFTAVEPDVLKYGLMRGETLFLATRPA